MRIMKDATTTGTNDYNDENVSMSNLLGLTFRITF